MKMGMACALIFGACCTAPVSAQTVLPFTNSAAPAASTAVEAPGTSPLALEAPLTPPPESPVYGIAESNIPQRVWFNAEYLMAVIRGQNSGPLLQNFPTNPPGTTPLTTINPTNIFPYSDRIQYHVFNGLKLQGGFWFANEPRLGIDASAFFLDQNTNGASFSSSGLGVGLDRPFIDGNTGNPAGLVFAAANPPTSGTITATSTVSSLWSADTNLRWMGPAIFSDQTDYLAGFRYMDFRERLDITGQSTLADGTKIGVSDHFATINQFYGAQFGFNSHLYGYQGFSFDTTFKLALGDIDQQVNISGSNTIVSPTGVVNTQNRGLYAQPSNIGSYSRNRFAALPDLNLNFSYHFTDFASVFLGYNVLFLDRVVRPSSQIDPVVSESALRTMPNPTTGPNSNQPQFSFHAENFWVQALSVGFRLQY